MGGVWLLTSQRGLQGYSGFEIWMDAPEHSYQLCLWDTLLRRILQIFAKQAKIRVSEIFAVSIFAVGEPGARGLASGTAKG